MVLLQLNKNYDDLFKQFEEARSILLERNVSVSDKIKAAKTFFALVSIVEDLRNVKFSPEYIEELIDSDVIDFIFDQNVDERNNFLQNKSRHLKILYRGYQSLGLWMEDLDDRLLSISEDIFQDGDDKKFLQEFFSSCPEVFKAYQDASERGEIYPLFSFLTMEGLTVFNLVRGTSCAFVKEENKSFSDLATVPHEIGHVIDFSKSLDGQVSLEFDLFREVLSNYYEQQFLFTFFEQGNDKAYLSLLHYYSKYLKILQEGYYLANLSSSSLEEHFLNPSLMFMLEKELIRDGLLSEDEMTYSDRLVDFDVSMMYSYGFLLSTYLLDHPDKLDGFMKLRNEKFGFLDLEDIGITPLSISESIDRRCGKVFSK